MRLPSSLIENLFFVVCFHNVAELILAQAVTYFLEFAQELIDLNPSMSVELNVDQVRLVSQDLGEEFTGSAHLSLLRR